MLPKLKSSRTETRNVELLVGPHWALVDPLGPLWALVGPAWALVRSPWALVGPPWALAGPPWFLMGLALMGLVHMYTEGTIVRVHLLACTPFLVPLYPDLVNVYVCV